MPKVPPDTNLSNVVEGTQAGQIGATSPILVMISNLGDSPEIITSIHLSTDPNMGHDGYITPTLIKSNDNVLFELWFSQAGLDMSFKITERDKISIYLNIAYSQTVGAPKNKNFSVGKYNKSKEILILGGMNFPFETSNIWIEVSRAWWAVFCNWL